MSTARADRLRTRVAVVAAGLVTLHSVVVLAGWAAGWSLFLTPSPRFIPMAPTTALAAPGPRPHYAGALATISAIIGATVALGYGYGTPLLYGGGTIPVALPTGLSLLVLGIATVLTAGPDVWPLDRLVGDHPRARMLRAFLPATA